ncbi:DUF2931 family protein [Pseudomonas sp. NPDC088444]|uniref:DUF2931 family protein n=1 Tax=Pseudomonas sp. NPDC088444 TaxID=3364456 RepID=UPI00384B891F
MAINKLKVLLGGALVVVLGGCSHVNYYGGKLPYDSWRLGFFAPNYMEVWIETADVMDINDKAFKRAMSGVAAVQTPPNFRGDPAGWPKRPGGGAGKQVSGASLPRFIYVRWQSLAEPQTYQAYIEIPQRTREAMLKGEHAYCKADEKWIVDFRDFLTIGLAPGGVTKTWIQGGCLEPIEVSRVQGQIVKKGPYGGLSDGHYYRPPNQESQAYIDKFGIPYDSW